MKEIIFAVENYCNTVTMEILRGELLGFICREDVKQYALYIISDVGGGYQLGKLLSLVI